MKKSNGFTLVELMISVLIVGVLAAIAYPSYMNTVRKTHRSDATVTLNDLATRLQRCFTANSTFVHNATATATMPITTCDVAVKVAAGVTTENKYYVVKGTDITATTFTLTAEPPTGGVQAKDTDCMKFVLDHTGRRKAQNGSGGDTTATCW